MLEVIIPTRDKGSRLRLCLRSLAEAAREGGGPDAIIVVDDGSRDETPAVLDSMRAELGALLQVVRRDTPGGRSVARNTGAASATGDHLLFLDDDMLASGELIRRHAEIQRETHAPVLVRATILNLPWLRFVRDPAGSDDALPEAFSRRLVRSVDGASLTAAVAPHARRSRFEADLHRLLMRSAARGRWLASTGGNLSIHRGAFERLGGFDERMGLCWGAEDIEFGYRAEQAGISLVHLADVVAYHMDHSGGGREHEHAVALRYFGQKHGEVLGGKLAAYFRGTLDVCEVSDS